VTPFNNLSVREAIAHAINYSQIIQYGFGGYAEQWVGPVPPSYPDYNPAGLPPYSFNLTLAQQEIQNSPCANNACKSSPIKYEYIDIGADWANTAQFLVADLNAIGLTIQPDKISLSDLYVEQTYDTTLHACTTATTAYGGPLYMGQEFYTSDYISPDDWTFNDAISYGSANLCMSGYNNPNVDQNVTNAASESSPAAASMDYTNITNMMYYNYTDIWLVVPTAFAVYSSNLHGIITNPMASAEPYAFLFNTQWLSSS